MTRIDLWKRALDFRVWTPESGKIQNLSGSGWIGWGNSVIGSKLEVRWNWNSRLEAFLWTPESGFCQPDHGWFPMAPQCGVHTRNSMDNIHTVPRQFPFLSSALKHSNKMIPVSNATRIRNFVRLPRLKRRTCGLSNTLLNGLEMKLF